jgi:hypothetical protein
MEYTGSRQRKSGPLEPLTPSRGFKSVPDTIKPTTPEPTSTFVPPIPLSWDAKLDMPFPPKVITETDAIPGEDDLSSRWVTVAAVDDTD